ncbi:MAG: uL30 family ribosomal protein [Candidatus Aenigmarchaeota archaeon]|nr:uL30 family ribosomal protein [Candidatus Aenigmarchaeota archaeon]
MLAAIRLKGEIKARRDIKDTMQMLGLKKKLSLSVLPSNPQTISMLTKTQNFIAWGELSAEMEKQFGGKKTIALRPSKGGFKSLKQMYPKGDLGYRGEAINEMIKRMM